VTCTYLTGSGVQDAPAIQRQVLDSVDAWTRELSKEAVWEIGEDRIVRQIEAFRARLLANESAPVSQKVDMPDRTDGVPDA
jgi:hypothetical protein